MKLLLPSVLPISCMFVIGSYNGCLHDDLPALCAPNVILRGSRVSLSAFLLSRGIVDEMSQNSLTRERTDSDDFDTILGCKRLTVAPHHHERRITLDKDR
jgi:hypothetical protein